MIKKDEFLKVIFGLIIFLFSVALAYFTATYVQKSIDFDYWNVLLLFAGVYLVVGLITVKIYPISLGFLFSADVLILNNLYENFGNWDDIVKTLIVGGILIVLYLIAWFVLADKEDVVKDGPTANGTPNLVSPSSNV